MFGKSEKDYGNYFILTRSNNSSSNLFNFPKEEGRLINGVNPKSKRANYFRLSNYSGN